MIKNFITVTLCLIWSFQIYSQSQQQFGEFASAIKLNNTATNQFYNTTGVGTNQINPSGIVFTNQNLGVFLANSNTLQITGAEIKTFKTPGANVCGGRLFYTVYPTSTPPTSPLFTMVNIPFKVNCNVALSQFEDLLGPCTSGDQKWSTESLNISLTNRCPGNYTLEIYYEYEGSTENTTSCGTIRFIKPTVGNYKANFTITSNFNLLASSANSSICAGQNIVLSASTTGGFSPYSIQWSGPNGFSSTSSNPTIPNASPVASGNYNVTVVDGCGESKTAIVSQSVNPLQTPTFSFNNTLTICSGNTVPILPPIANNNITGTWAPSTISNTSSGNYIFTPTPGQCAVSYSLTITVNPNIAPQFNFGNNILLCSGAVAPILPGTSLNNIIGNWTPSSINNNQSGIYTFVPANNQCAFPTSVNVTINSIPIVNAGPDKTIIAGSNTSLDASATNYSNFFWNNNIGNTSLTPIVNPTVTTTYTLTATSASGCTATDEVTVTVLPYCIEVMKAFTPNGDGQYDLWKIIKGTNCTKKIAVKVFNRYGGLVYENINYQNNWDGTYKGFKVTDATYYYLLDITLLDDRKLNLKGDVTILR